MRLTFVAVLLFVALAGSASAQDYCPACTGTFTISARAGVPVTIHLDYQTPTGGGGNLPPTFTIVGNTIHVSEGLSTAGVIEIVGTNSVTVNVGVLPQGNYTVVWEQHDPNTDALLKTFTTAFVVPPDVPAVDARTLALIALALTIVGGFALKL